jgi:hypothetical protein
MPKSDSKSPLIIAAIIGLVIIALAIFSAISFFTNGDENPAGLSDKGTANLVKAVKAHLNLPENEDPIVGEITDANALVAQQAFYAGVKNGDFLLMFPQNQKAVLYNAKEDILINVGPIVIKQETATTEEAEIEFEGAVVIDIRNGGETAGAAGKLADALGENNDYEIGAVGNAANSNYEQTTIVVINDSVPESVISALAEELSASVAAQLPLGEKESSADILVIIGTK